MAALKINSVARAKWIYVKLIVIKKIDVYHVYRIFVFAERFAGCAGYILYEMFSMRNINRELNILL